MARLRMTYKNLKALRKTKEYQALLVDLVANNIVPKSVAENLLGYNIPANLIGGVEPDNEDDNPVVEPTNTVTLLYFKEADPGEEDEWKTATYTLTGEDTDEDILTAAKEAFSDNTLNAICVVEENPEYTEGEDDLNDKYLESDPQPETLEAGMLIIVLQGRDDDK